MALVSATTEKFIELARVPAITGKTWTHLALAGNVLLVRNGEDGCLPIGDAVDMRFSLISALLVVILAMSLRGTGSRLERAATNGQLNSHAGGHRFETGRSHFPFNTLRASFKNRLPVFGAGCHWVPLLLGGHSDRVIPFAAAAVSPGELASKLPNAR